MTALTLLVGALLSTMGVVAYAATGAESLTALIPSVVGVLLVVAGLLARKASLHRHAVHGALVVALLGLLGSLMNVARVPDVVAGTAERPAAVVVSTLMAVVLLGYLVAGIQSFVRARRRRAAASV
ncbi:hypothetical protein [Pseudokineococcus sp. 1T1Z-3]|uniref:hypothetical protein n=1 Tax=Pseudokineococcus sp. 1T1Z-3 TaxID=3132745 RepID=UPI0030A1EC05